MHSRNLSDYLVIESHCKHRMHACTCSGAWLKLYGGSMGILMLTGTLADCVPAETRSESGSCSILLPLLPVIMSASLLLRSRLCLFSRPAGQNAPS